MRALTARHLSVTRPWPPEQQVIWLRRRALRRACGAGYIRTAFANLKPDVCREASARLKAGLTQLVKHGMTVPATVAAGASAS